MSVARTVAGDVDVTVLGRVDYHEHLFQVTPLLPGDELDDESASTAEASMLRESGFESLVDATPVGLGRRPSALVRVATATGLHVVAATGAHREEHYAWEPWVLELPAAELAARGAFLGYDGPARARSAPDSVILRCLEDCVAAGYAGSLLLGGDVARATRYRAYGGLPRSAGCRWRTPVLPSEGAQSRTDAPSHRSGGRGAAACRGVSP